MGSKMTVYKRINTVRNNKARDLDVKRQHTQTNVAKYFKLIFELKHFMTEAPILIRLRPKLFIVFAAVD